MAGPDVICVGSNGAAQVVLKRIEREASHRYQTLTLPEEGPAGCLFVNGTLVHRSKEETPKCEAVSMPSCCSFLVIAKVLIHTHAGVLRQSGLPQEVGRPLGIHEGAASTASVLDVPLAPQNPTRATAVTITSSLVPFASFTILRTSTFYSPQMY